MYATANDEIVSSALERPEQQRGRYGDVLHFCFRQTRDDCVSLWEEIRRASFRNKLFSTMGIIYKVCEEAACPVRYCAFTHSRK